MRAVPLPQSQGVFPVVNLGLVGSSVGFEFKSISQPRSKKLENFFSFKSEEAPPTPQGWLNSPQEWLNIRACSTPAQSFQILRTRQ